MSLIEKNLMSVIVVEDDKDLRNSIIKYLQLKGFDVTGVGTALAFYSKVAVKEYHVAILNLTLPDQDGHIIAKYIRANTSMRIIMLTSKAACEDRLVGYESGADVCLVKPADLRVLAASLFNIFNRLGAGPPDGSDKQISSNGCSWLLSREKWTLSDPDGDSKSLTSKEFSFLRLLGEAKGNIVSRDELLAALEYPLTQSAHSALESLVYRLRKKISITQDTPIKTASGFGFSFIATIEII